MATTSPTKQPGTRLAVVIEPDGVKIYGNPIAFKALSGWLDWIASADAKEHFECHLLMDMECDDVRLHGKKPSNVSVLFSENLIDSFVKPSSTNSGFELTFMAVEDKDLDEMDKNQSTRLLPRDWNSSAE